METDEVRAFTQAFLTVNLALPVRGDLALAHRTAPMAVQLHISFAALFVCSRWLRE